MKMLLTNLQWKILDLQDGVDIHIMLPASTLHQNTNMEYNIEYYDPLMNGKMSK